MADNQRFRRLRHNLALRQQQPRVRYTRTQKETAVDLLNKGLKSRQVARLIGPQCSSATPTRWRKVAAKQQEIRGQLTAMFDQIPNYGHNPPKTKK